MAKKSADHQRWLLLLGAILPGVIKWSPFWGGIKQCKLIGILKDFPKIIVHCLGLVSIHHDPVFTGNLGFVGRFFLVNLQG